MRRRTVTILPALLASAWLLSLFAPVLSPARALANRDIPTFHLPLRTAFRELAAFGLPQWNPWLHGGQPILSNPSYAAFYPPSWLVLAVPPAYALSLLAILHAGLAFAGAWFLARRLGCGRGAAALAGIGFSGCGAYLSFLSAFNLFWGITWLPWVLAWGDAALAAGPGERWWRPGLLAGGALGLALLNGEPATAMMSGLGLLALTVDAAVLRGRLAWKTAARALVPVLFGGALAAVQLVPTLSRLAESPRRGLTFAVAADWSMPPARLIETVFPRFFGDGARSLEGLFFGWTLNDGHYPYVESLYPGLLLTVLGVAALARRGIPRRGAWFLACAGGWFLALGRHNPAYGWLRRAFPPLAVLRYPEKFAVLGVLVLALAGILGWQRLLEERRAGRPESAGLPLALALAVLAAASALAILLRLAPGLAERFIASHAEPGPGSAVDAARLAYLRGESWIAVATAVGVAALLALCRWNRPPQRLLQGLALVLLAADLWHQEHGLVRSAPAALYRTPPSLAAGLLPARNRIFLQPAGEDPVDLTPVLGDLQSLIARNKVATLQPYSALLWDIPYVFEIDFELMLTRWGQRATDVFRAEWALPQRGYRFLGVWNVGDVFLHRTPAEQEAMLRDPSVRDAGGIALRRVANPYLLPRFRFVPRVSFHRTYAEALAVGRALAWKVARDEQCVGQPVRTLTYAQPPQPLELVDEGGRIRLGYRAAEGAFLVAAITFDEGWRASLEDGSPLAVHPTAASQIGVELPAGEHRLRLEYREPLVGEGAAITLAALAAGIAVFCWPLRPGRREAAEA
ncbi:MAG TPA: hypothetical protein VGS07_32625 [Thermoanaerobaculia bacterium]|jgi:hypothetical protein|nr:hypothetical protein [Thermoanaerobaculia bacterium]